VVGADGRATPHALANAGVRAELTVNAALGKTYETNDRRKQAVSRVLACGATGEYLATELKKAQLRLCLRVRIRPLLSPGECLIPADARHDRRPGWWRVVPEPLVSELFTCVQAEFTL
jgi:hypothetical protein